MTPTTEDTTAVRLSVLGVVCLSLFAALFVRLWFLQIIDAGEFQVEANAVHLRTIHEEGPRGRILDRKGRVLVDNKISIVVGLDHQALRPLEGDDPTIPAEAEAMEQRADLFARLAAVLEPYQPTKVSEIEAKFQDKRYGPLDFVPIIDEVPEELQVYLAEHADEFPGVEVKRRAVRTYPYGTAASHILGYVGQINESELAARQELEGESELAASKPYEPGDEIGKTGIERSFEEYLRAVPGQTEIQVDARGDYVRTTKEPSLTPGDDVWLTIDIDLQIHAERELAATIRSRNPSQVCDSETRCNASEGAVVITEPTTGAVLAMASNPTFDLSDLVNGISTEKWEELTDEDGPKAMFNRALSGGYAPGSTFKMVTAHAGLETGFISPEDTISDGGAYRLDNCTAGKCEFTNAGRVAYGSVNLQKSLTVSSDVYYYRIGDRLWRARDVYGDTPIQNSAEAFGFGSPTGIALPSESGGLIGTPEWLARVYEENPENWARGDWKVGDNLNTAIGQGLVSVTPLQLTNAYATFANGGTRYTPHIVQWITRPKDLAKSVVDSENTELVVEFGPEVAGTVEFTDPADYNAMYRGFVGVTQDGGGTMTPEFREIGPPFPVAGKTGTAEVDGKADTSVFAGWGPADAISPPQWAIAAVIPEGGFGDAASGPLVLRLFKALGDGAVPVAEAEPVPELAIAAPPTTTTILPEGSPLGSPENGAGG